MVKTGMTFTDLVYDEETGIITRSGRICGTPQRTGYIRTSYGGRLYMNHRLAWRIKTGEFPIGQIDHINGIRSDNRWCNLRELTNQQNQFNRKVRKDSSTGLKGVSVRGGRYRASIWVDGKEKHLGYYKTVEEAKLVYDEIAKELHGEYFNSGA